MAVAKTVLQLLIHLASLGRTSAATVLPEARGHEKEALWTWFYQLNAMSYWLLSTPILIGNMLLAMIGLTAVPAMLARPETVVPWAPPAQHAAGLAPYAALLLGLAAAAGMGRLAFSRSGGAGRRQAAFGLILPALLVSAAAAATGFLAFGEDGWVGTDVRPTLLAAFEVPFLFLSGDAAMRDYDRSRPGAFLIWRAMAGGLALAACGVVGFLVVASPAGLSVDPSALLVLSIAYATNGMFLVLLVLWLLLYLSNLSLLLLGAVLWARTSLSGGDASSAGLLRAVGTCFLASLPAALLLAAVLTFWSLLLHAYTPLVPELPFRPWLDVVFGDVRTTTEFMRSMLDQTAGALFLPYSALMTAAAVVVAWSLLPSVIREIVPAEDDGASSNLGGWLDGAFPAIALAGVLAGFAHFVVLPVSTGLMIAFHSKDALPALLQGSGLARQSFYEWTGLFISAATMGVVAASKLL